ncbi:MAG: RDD family protein [Clostridiaceae bacterium]
MKKVKILTPDNIEVEYLLADIGSRGAAAGIDTLIINIFLFLMLFIGILIVNYAPSFWDEYYGWLIGAGIFLYGFINYAYYIIAELKMNGQTPGKKIVGIRTIRTNGEAITFKHSALRNLFKILMDYYGIGLILIFFSSNRKRLGDIVASTMVVIENKQEAPVTLEELKEQSSDGSAYKNNFSYYLTDEENNLLRDYYDRKDSLESPEELRQSLKEYFTEKFTEEGTLHQVQDFINRI